MLLLIKALVSRLKDDVALHLLGGVAVAYIVASLGEADFWLVAAVMTVLVVAWHTFGKAYRDKITKQREAEREQNQREERRRRRAVQIAYRSVEDAYKIASTRTLHGVLDPQFDGRYYDELMYARNATDDVAQFIEDPPAPLGDAATVEHLGAWLAVLRDVRAS